MCNGHHNYNLSFINLQKMCGRATLDELMNYKLTLCLFKLYNVEFNPVEFVRLDFNQILTGRQTNFITLKSNYYKVGINSSANRLYLLNKNTYLCEIFICVNSNKPPGC